MRQPSQASHLFEQARGGNPAALEALLREVQPQLYRYSLKMCRKPEDAEDVLQDTLLTLARSLRDFRGASSLSTWLFTITRSFCIKKRRKSKFAPDQLEPLPSVASGESSQIASTLPSPHQHAESAELWQQIKAGIQRIDPTYREVLVLRDIEGLRAKEVADIVGISVSAVKSRLHRARAQLREHLATTPYHPKPGCPDIRKVFSKHLEGELSPDVCATMESHLANCPACATECDGLKQVLGACSTAPCQVPQAVQQRVQAALRSVLGEANR